MSETPDFLDGEIVAVLAGRIEARFGTPLDELIRSADQPSATVGLTSVIHAYGLLTQAQSALEEAEDALVAALETATGEVVDDPVMSLAHQVNQAVEVRDTYAQWVRALVEVPAGPQRARTSPAPRLTTTLPVAAPARPAQIGIAR
ncbi:MULTISPECIES: hypothetical protein [unclassified Streptomyces]|uniref:hypothetical protein n=1 Tax=unclassified Streptomyces TaxID=2593676 RepID=UPI0035D66640